MGSLEANIEMVVMARNLPNDHIGFHAGRLGARGDRYFDFAF
jgi:hypothetical protein